MGRLIHEASGLYIPAVAMAVLNELKHGPDNKLYEHALVDNDDYPCYPCNPWSEDMSNMCDGRHLKDNSKIKQSYDSK